MAAQYADIKFSITGQIGIIKVTTRYLRLDNICSVPAHG